MAEVEGRGGGTGGATVGESGAEDGCGCDGCCRVGVVLFDGGDRRCLGGQRFVLGFDQDIPMTALTNLKRDKAV